MLYLIIIEEGRNTKKVFKRIFHLCSSITHLENWRDIRTYKSNKRVLIQAPSLYRLLLNYCYVMWLLLLLSCCLTIAPHYFLQFCLFFFCLFLWKSLFSIWLFAPKLGFDYNEILILFFTLFLTQLFDHFFKFWEITAKLYSSILFPKQTYSTLKIYLFYFFFLTRSISSIYEFSINFFYCVYFEILLFIYFLVELFQQFINENNTTEQQKKTVYLYLMTIISDK